MNKPASLVTFSALAALLASPIVIAQPAGKGAGKPASMAAAADAAAPRFARQVKIGVARGEKIYVEYCAVCHGLHGKGDGPRAAFFADIQYIPDLTVDGFLDDRDPELLDNIRQGLARYDEPAIVMPQFKYILGENDIRSALAYVKTFAPPKLKKGRGG
ncbi:MAG: cytochrome c [Methylobacteriaceae bacterium]|nr:cytochrome c [Methylobacteriaceae bacterium]